MRVAKPTKAETTQHRKSTPRDLLTLADETARVMDRDQAMDLLVTDRFYQAEPQIALFLDSPEAQLRGDAIYGLLGRWLKRDYYDTAVTLLRSDPSWYVRTQAATALAWFGRWSEQEGERDHVVRDLVAALYSEPDDITQGAVYEEVVELLQPDGPDYDPPDPFDRERDVDTALIAPYMTAEATGEE